MMMKTMAQTTIESELASEIAAVAADAGCQLLEIKLAGNTLRVVLDHPQGVTLAHCETVSRQLSALLDVHDFGRERYVLEVTSPGLDRPLYGPADYRRFRGKLARITYDAPAGGRRTIVGRLEDFTDEDGGRLTVIEADGGVRHAIPLAGVVRARLEIEL